jgi:putative nucleotidyltransferase with HDIG domain
MHSVLVVDDEPFLRDIATLWVRSAGFTAREAASAEAALEALELMAADIALCDINMPGQDGVWLAAQIRELYPTTAIVIATSLVDVETAIASLRNDVVDYLLKPFDRARLSEALALARDWHTAAVAGEGLHHALRDRLRSRRVSVAAALAERQADHETALEGLMSMLQLHDQEGRGHATRVARLALALADEIGVDDGVLQALERGALLHDIGKLDMPVSILSKPAPLSESEWRVMRTHPQVGYDLVRSQSRLSDAADIVLAHHEAYDGTGYPRGLRGDEIPICARILAVADAYDSMTQPHTQRPPLPPAMAVSEIERCSGRQFDPQCAEALGSVFIHVVEEHRLS